MAGHKKEKPASSATTTPDPTKRLHPPLMIQHRGKSHGSMSMSMWTRILKVLGIHAYPAAGTPAWCGLDDCDPVKLAGVLDYGQHHALRVETAQEASCQASHAISGARDWAAVAKRVQDSAEWFATYPWMRRRP